MHNKNRLHPLVRKTRAAARKIDAKGCETHGDESNRIAHFITRTVRDRLQKDSDDARALLKIRQLREDRWY